MKSILDELQRCSHSYEKRHIRYHHTHFYMLSQKDVINIIDVLMRVRIRQNAFKYAITSYALSFVGRA